MKGAISVKNRLSPTTLFWIHDQATLCHLSSGREAANSRLNARLARRQTFNRASRSRGSWQTSYQCRDVDCEEITSDTTTLMTRSDIGEIGAARNERDPAEKVPS